MIAITAANSALGLQVAKQLLAQGVSPNKIAAITPVSAADEQLPDELAPRRADFNDGVSLHAAFRGAETLVLIPSDDPIDIRIRQHSLAIEAAKTSGVKRLIFISKSCARPDSEVLITPFLVYAESALRSSGLQWLILRPGLSINAIAQCIAELKSSHYISYPVTQGRANYVSQFDVARTVAAAARKPKLHDAIYELTGPAAISMHELASAVSRTVNQQILFRTITDEQYLERCKRDGLSHCEARTQLSFFHGIDADEFSRATDHVEKLTGESAESVQAALKRLVCETNKK